MKRKFFVMALLLAICFVFAACDAFADGAGGMNTTSTTYGIYDLYSLSMIPCQTKVNESLSGATLDDSDRANINLVVGNMELLKDDERAIMASIECCNYISSVKEVTLLREGSDRIFVKQQNGKFHCKMEYDGVISKEYSFDVSKTGKTYSITYLKDARECKAVVVFNNTTSNIQMTLNAYDGDTKVELRKQFYELKNNNYALRINWAKGAASNRAIYGIDYFREVLNFNAKVSSLKNFDATIALSELTYDNFVTVKTNDDSCYTLKAKNTAEVTVGKFGNFYSW